MDIISSNNIEVGKRNIYPQFVYIYPTYNNQHTWVFKTTTNATL